MARTKRRGDDVVVVVSAMGKETDELIRLAGEVSKVRPGPGDGHAHHRRRAQGHRPAVHGAARPRRAGRQLHRQPGRVHHRHHPHQRQDRRAPPRAARGGAATTAARPVVGGAQGVSTDRDVTFLGRGGSDTTAVALAHALGADCVRALHRRVRRVHRPIPRLVPDARRMAHGQLRRDARDDRERLPEAGHALGRVRPHAGACALHVRSAFTWEPGTWVQEEDPSMEQAIVSAVVHDTSEAKVTVVGRARPARHRRPAVPARWPTPTSTST